MDNKLQELKTQHPSLFKGYFKNRSIQCKDGWYTILKELIEKLDEHVQSEYFSFIQIKEKFGVLRIYTSTTSDEIEELINQAVRKSETTCDVCGDHGTLVNDNNWLKTRCEQHRGSR